MKKFILIPLIVLVIASGLFSQDWKGQGRLIGLVVDEQDKPIEGVTVKLDCPKWNGGFSVTTDAEGKWTGAWMRSGLWNLSFSKIGYVPAQRSFQINQFERNKEMKVVLKKAEGITVTEEMKKDLTAANDLFDQKDYTGALAAYQAFLVKFPDGYFIWRNIGNCYFVQENYDQAEASYKEFLAKDAKDAITLVSIGNCYSNRGDTDKAMEWYAMVPIDKIQDANMLYTIGLAYFKVSKLEDAQKYLQKAVELNETDTDSLYQLGLTYTALQNKDEALATFEKYLLIDPDSDRAGQVKGFIDYLKK